MKSVAVGDAIHELMKDRRFAERRAGESVFAAWEEALGQPECRMARPLSLEDGVLTVSASTSTVASEVSLSQESYLGRLNRYFGSVVVRELRVRVHQGSPPLRASQRSTQSPREDFDPKTVSLTAGEVRWADETAAEVESPELRKALKRVLLLRLKHAKWMVDRKHKR